MFTNFKDLHEAYGFTNPNKTRADLGNEERAFVNDCFDTYEHIGFSETFQAVDGFSDFSLNGLKFTVLRRLKDFDDTQENGKEGDVELEALPMWEIRMEDGRIVGAFPEEICLAEQAEDGYPHYADVYNRREN